MIKVDGLALLLSHSSHALVYTGCGISVSVGVAQTARGQRFVEPRSGELSDRSALLRSEKKTEAVPGMSHFSLTSLLRVRKKVI